MRGVSMRYQGGKSRIAGELAQAIAKAVGGGQSFVSLFCGSCAVESKVQGFSEKILNDNHKYLIAMLRGVQGGYILPESISPEEYRYIREHKDEDPILAGFVGFGCSFGGKWFGGYARNASGTNYAAQSKRSLLADMATLQDARFECNDYRKVRIPLGAVIYADPPYRGVTGYKGQKFDSDEFWWYMRLLSATGHDVFVSEQSAPPGIACIWEKPFRRTLDRDKGNQPIVTERLFYLPAGQAKEGFV